MSFNWPLYGNIMKTRRVYDPGVGICDGVNSSREQRRDGSLSLCRQAQLSVVKAVIIFNEFNRMSALSLRGQ